MLIPANNKSASSQSPLFPFHVDSKTPKHKYPFVLRIPMFPTRKTYVSALGNVRFTDGKHTVLEWKT